MAKKTAAAETPAKDSVDVKHESYAHCADGCGSRVNSAKSTFLQGHDQRLISDLSTRVAVGDMGPFQRGLLNLVDDPKPAQGEFTYIETRDIMDRINTVSAAVAARFSAGLADKFTSAAMAKWDKSVRQGDLREARAQRAANPAPKRVRKAKAAKVERPTPEQLEQAANDITDAGAIGEGKPTSTVGQPIENLRGTEVKVKIGRWTYDAIVVGMNQAGKITAVEYTNNKGDEKTTDRFVLVD